MKNSGASNSDTALIQQRNKKILKVLTAERAQIEANLKKQFQIFIRRYERSHLGPLQLEQCFEILSCFLKACLNLLAVYFPVMSAQDFISLQTENQLLNRVEDLKNGISRSFKSLCCKISFEGEEKSKKNSNRTPNETTVKKSSNVKTPIQNSVVLTEWLLRRFNNPYPSNQQKQKLAEESNLSVPQVNNWFINSRERVIKKYIKKQSKETGYREKRNLEKQSSSK